MIDHYFCVLFCSCCFLTLCYVPALIQLCFESLFCVMFHFGAVVMSSQ
jgi:hypothetical protein